MCSSRRWAAAIVATLGLLTAQAAHAQGSSAGATADCVSAFDRAQTLRDGGQLLAARTALESCARAECPSVVTSKCVPWLEEVNRALPSIVIVAKDGKGNDVVDVRVRLGDTILAETLDGRPIELDPGAHTLRFERKGSEPIEQQIVARQGEKLRAVEVRFAEPTPPPAVAPAPPKATPPKAPSPRHDEPPKADQAKAGGVSPLVWVGFGVGGAGLLVGSVAGILAFKEKSRIEDQCNTACTQDDIDKGKRVATISTLGFVVAGVGTAVGVAALLGSSSGEAKDDRAARAKRSLRVGIGPGGLGLSGRF